jgi:hypothetical protein
MLEQLLGHHALNVFGQRSTRFKLPTSKVRAIAKESLEVIASGRKELVKQALELASEQTEKKLFGLLEKQRFESEEEARESSHLVHMAETANQNPAETCRLLITACELVEESMPEDQWFIELSLTDLLCTSYGTKDQTTVQTARNKLR